MKKHKELLAIVLSLVTLLGVAWAGGARISILEAVAADYQVHKSAQGKREEETVERLARVETMVEMMLNATGLVPPPKKYGQSH